MLVLNNMIAIQLFYSKPNHCIVLSFSGHLLLLSVAVSAVEKLGGRKGKEPGSGANGKSSGNMPSKSKGKAFFNMEIHPV